MIKKYILLTFTLIPFSSIALSIMDPCIKEMPKNIQFGEVKMSYRISNTCEPMNVEYEISEPNGAFEKLAMCSIQRVPIGWNPHSSNKPMSEEHYEKMTEGINDLITDKYYHRSINALNNKGKDVTLTCHFNKNWELIGHSVKKNLKTKPITTEYINSLPEQNFESLYEVEDTE